MIIFDIDGTLSQVGDRLRYLKKTPKDWDKFYTSCNEDKVNLPIAHLYKVIHLVNKIKVVTGRRESTRKTTLDWFEQNNLPLLSKDLLMRADDDYRADVLVKHELCKGFMDRITTVFEDRDCMVDYWRHKGVVCLQVAYGDF